MGGRRVGLGVVWCKSGRNLGASLGRMVGVRWSCGGEVVVVVG